MSEQDANAHFTPVRPYGNAVWDALKRGDVHEMEAVAAAARKALHPVEFQTVTDDVRDDVKKALSALESKLAELKHPKS